MNKAYRALRAMLDPAQRAAFAKAQVAWLSQRDGDCNGKHGADLGACLADETGKRSRVLNAAPEAGPGYSGKLVPFFRVEKAGKGTTDVDVQGFRFAAHGSGAHRAFNAAVDKSLGDIRQPQAGDPSVAYAFGLTMTLAYGSPHLLSAHAEIYADLGGAHPSSIRTADASSFSTTSPTSPARRKFSRIVSVKCSPGKRNTKATTLSSSTRRR
jgi:lysozyme inhibitor LprI